MPKGKRRADPSSAKRAELSKRPPSPKRPARSPHNKKTGKRLPLSTKIKGNVVTAPDFYSKYTFINPENTNEIYRGTNARDQALAEAKKEGRNLILESNIQRRQTLTVYSTETAEHRAGSPAPPDQNVGIITRDAYLQRLRRTAGQRLVWSSGPQQGRSAPAGSINGERIGLHSICTAHTEYPLRYLQNKEKAPSFSWQKSAKRKAPISLTTAKNTGQNIGCRASKKAKKHPSSPPKISSFPLWAPASKKKPVFSTKILYDRNTGDPLPIGTKTSEDTISPRVFQKEYTFINPDNLNEIYRGTNARDQALAEAKKEGRNLMLESNVQRRQTVRVFAFETPEHRAGSPAPTDGAKDEGIILRNAYRQRLLQKAGKRLVWANGPNKGRSAPTGSINRERVGLHFICTAHEEYYTRKYKASRPVPQEVPLTIELLNEISPPAPKEIPVAVEPLNQIAHLAPKEVPVKVEPETDLWEKFVAKEAASSRPESPFLPWRQGHLLQFPSFSGVKPETPETAGDSWPFEPPKSKGDAKKKKASSVFLRRTLR